MRTILIIGLTFGFNFVFSQNLLKIQGKVLDERTKQALPFVNIVCENFKTSTSANENGEFEIFVKDFPVQLIFSFVGYNKKKLYVEQYIGHLEVNLKSSTILLSEVIISGVKDDNYVKKLVLSAYKRAAKQCVYKSFAKAFYRQTTRNDNAYSEVYEIFYKAQVSTKGIDQWQIEQGRYAVSSDIEEKNYVYTLNFTALSESFTLFGENVGGAFIMPVNKFTLKKYNLNISKILRTDGRKIAVIDFVPNPKLKKPALAGQLWIDIDNYDILRINGELKDPKLRLIDISGPKSKWSNYLRKYDIAFKTIKDTLLVPDYFKVEHSMNYSVKNKFNNRKIVTSSALTFYEYTDSLSIDNYLNHGKEDIEKIQITDYNHQFWQDNPFLSRTPLEEEVIRSLQERGSVGTLFISAGDK